MIAWSLRSACAAVPVLVVAATDIDEVERQPRPQLGSRLCIVASRWPRQSVDRVRDHLLALAERWRIFFVGEGANEQAQAVIEAHLTHITAEVADWVDGLPDGLLTLRPWLSPDEAS